jgi:hypothetical protein
MRHTFKFKEEVTSPPPQPFPPCAYLNWGPGTAFFKYGLQTYQTTATILTREGKVELLPLMDHWHKFLDQILHDKEL